MSANHLPRSGAIGHPMARQAGKSAKHCFGEDFSPLEQPLAQSHTSIERESIRIVRLTGDAIHQSTAYKANTRSWPSASAILRSLRDAGSLEGL